MKKKASELAAGDIIVVAPLGMPTMPVPAPERRLVVGVIVPPDGSQMTAFYVPHLVLQPARLNAAPMYAMQGDEVHVEDRRTPAERRADELVELVRQALALPVAPVTGMLTPGWRRVAQELIDEIDPPFPPTAAELAEALNLACRHCGLPGEMEYPGNKDMVAVTELLDRARRAGLIGGAQ